MSSNEVEDVGAIVHERDGLRTIVRRLEKENRQLRAIVATYAERAELKLADRNEAASTLDSDAVTPRT